MQNKKISIVVPVHNVEKYLRECVDSLVNQTYLNLEIILIDDGSSDESAKICDEYATKDERIKVVHKRNGGSSSARRAGINIATGQYLMFVDSDDWIELDTIECCMRVIRDNTEIQCVLFPYVREYPQKSSEVHFFNGDQLFAEIEAKNKVYRRLFGPVGAELSNPENMDILVSCCMKLYHIDLVKEGKYFDTKEVGSSEDALFNIHALVNCNVYAYIDKCFYHYRKMEGTLTSTYRSQLVVQWGRLFDIIEEIISEKKFVDDYCVALQNRIALSSIGIGMNTISNRKQSFFKRKNEIREYLESIRYKKAIRQLDFSFLPLKWKIFLLCCKWRWAFCVSIMLFMMQKLKSKR